MGNPGGISGRTWKNWSIHLLIRTGCLCISKWRFREVQGGFKNVKPGKKKGSEVKESGRGGGCGRGG